MKITKTKNDLFCSSFVFQSEIFLFPVLGFQKHVCLVTSCCCSVGFCIALCVVLAMNSWAIQNKACISVAKCEHSPSKLVLYIIL